jgi:predicted tellurium resistance membrane protein TerC
MTLNNPKPSGLPLDFNFRTQIIGALIIIAMGVSAIWLWPVSLLPRYIGYLIALFLFYIGFKIIYSLRQIHLHPEKYYQYIKKRGATP